MLSRIRPRLTYANVMSTIAVFIVLGGVAWAQQRIGTAQIENRAVTAPKVANNSVVPRAIRKNAVRPAKINTNAVRPRHMNEGAVTTAKLSDGVVSTGKLSDGAVSTGKLANGAVDSAKLSNGAVTGAKLRDRAVTEAKIEPETIGPASLRPELRPLWARVGESGQLFSGRGAIAAERTGTGRYRVTFERDVANCSWTATVGRAGTGGGTSFGYAYGSGSSGANGITVATRFGTPPDDFNRPFHLQVIC